MSEDLSFLNYSQVFSDSSTKATPTPAIQIVSISYQSMAIMFRNWTILEANKQCKKRRLCSTILN